LTTANARAESLSNSEVLRARLALTTGRLDASYRRLWARPDVGALVVEFLVLMHQIVRASVPLMTMAQTLAAARQDDTVSARLARYLADHIHEECDHDVWVLEDLESVNVSRADVLGSIPSPSVASLVGAQYYWMQHHDPVALVGYMRVLEGNPPSRAHIERLQQLSGLPASALRTYRLHGELDPDHARDMDEFLDSLPLTDAQGHLIWISASHTANLVADCLDQLQPAAGRRRP
jgi:pyrroloquinoline quinone (PQQ) biosynthesis protein C